MGDRQGVMNKMVKKTSQREIKKIAPLVKSIAHLSNKDRSG